MSEASVVPHGKFYTQREVDNIAGLLQALTDTTMSSSEMAFLHVEALQLSARMGNREAVIDLCWHTNIPEEIYDYIRQYMISGETVKKC